MRQVWRIFLWKSLGGGVVMKDEILGSFLFDFALDRDDEPQLAPEEFWPGGRSFRCCFEGSHSGALLESGCCVEAAVFEVGGFVAGYELDDAAPHPVGGIQAFGLVLI